mmetsp:Transcript_100451/g.281471  ORF Transcript_100451/g.281471 Transcript_100451/m.281471 type:complete len:319 (+) Transcript_100451:719-1675(+)
MRLPGVRGAGGHRIAGVRRALRRLQRWCGPALPPVRQDALLRGAPRERPCAVRGARGAEDVVGAGAGGPRLHAAEVALLKALSAAGADAPVDVRPRGRRAEADANACTAGRHPALEGRRGDNDAQSARAEEDRARRQRGARLRPEGSGRRLRRRRREEAPGYPLSPAARRAGLLYTRRACRGSVTGGFAGSSRRCFARRAFLFWRSSAWRLCEGGACAPTLVQRSAPESSPQRGAGGPNGPHVAARKLRRSSAAHPEDAPRRMRMAPRSPGRRRALADVSMLGRGDLCQSPAPAATVPGEGGSRSARAFQLSAAPPPL